jgi:FKBP-type peptidyl-prolyl cis-trans isomerase FkpA
MKKLLGATMLALALAGCSENKATEDKKAEAAPTPAASAAQAATATASAAPVAGDQDALKMTDQVVGTGAEATAGKEVTVNYTGRLITGKTFDTSIGRAPFSFRLGAGQVIKGWDQGVAGMKVGGKRQLVIPPSLGYGSAGAGGVIPPDATLVFDVELLGVE